MAYEFESEVIQHELEDEFSGEGEEEFSGESSFEGEGWLGAIGNVVGSLLGEGEGEDESAYESSFESALESEEGELNPIRKIYPDAMMEHLGELAADAETEEEAADHFLPLIGMAASKLLPVVAKAVAPMAKQALPKIARAVTRATPHLTRGVGNMAKALHRNPQTRHLLRTVPTIARRTVGSIAKQAAHGRPITPGTAVRTLAQQTRRVLAHPQQRRRALRRHNNLERRFHGRYAPGLARPHWRWFRGRRYPFPAGYGTAGAPHPAGVPTPGAVRQAGAGTTMPGVRPGQMVGGKCTCAPCPTCGAAPGGQPAASAAPAYCRCCGQVLR
jgi:hypothetical protein